MPAAKRYRVDGPEGLERTKLTLNDAKREARELARRRRQTFRVSEIDAAGFPAATVFEAKP